MDQVNSVVFANAVEDNSMAEPSTVSVNDVSITLGFQGRGRPTPLKARASFDVLRASQEDSFKITCNGHSSVKWLCELWC